MKSYKLTDIAKIIGENLDKLRYNNKLIEAQRKIVNPTFLEILEELYKDDELLAASLMNWYMNKYGEDISDDKELTKLIMESIAETHIATKDEEDDYYSCGCWNPSNDRC